MLPWQFHNYLNEAVPANNLWLPHCFLFLPWLGMTSFDTQNLKWETNKEISKLIANISSHQSISGPPCVILLCFEVPSVIQFIARIINFKYKYVIFILPLAWKWSFLWSIKLKAGWKEYFHCALEENRYSLLRTCEAMTTPDFR